MVTQGAALQVMQAAVAEGTSLVVALVPYCTTTVPLHRCCEQGTVHQLCRKKPELRHVLDELRGNPVSVV